MAMMYMTNPVYKFETHDKHGRVIADSYFSKVTQAWYSIYRGYTERGDLPGCLELPKNARRSRVRQYEKLERYRRRVNNMLPKKDKA